MIHPYYSPLLSDKSSSPPPTGWSEQSAVQPPDPSGGEMHGPAILSSVRVDSPHLLPPPLGVVGPFLPLLLVALAVVLRGEWLRRRGLSRIFPGLSIYRQCLQSLRRMG